LGARCSSGDQKFRGNAVIATIPIIATIKKTSGTKKWWLREHGVIWQEWALILPRGSVAVYDQDGKTVRRSSYGSWWRARAALRLKGFRPLKAKELDNFSPPDV
jgi:hypothetical protein